MVIYMADKAVSRIPARVVCKLNRNDNQSKKGRIKNGNDFSIVGASSSCLRTRIKMVRKKRNITDSKILLFVIRNLNFLFQDRRNGVNKRTLVTLGIHQKNHRDIKFCTSNTPFRYKL
jgi:hypothetical protein